jgi:SAM-dependent methyltransferase
MSPLGRIREGIDLYKRHKAGVSDTVNNVLTQARNTERHISSLICGPVSGLRMLEIGPGQHLIQLLYFGQCNEVWGIDLDVVLERLSLAGCLAITRNNGWIRACKTITRKLLGIDEAVRSEVISRLALRNIPKLNVEQMDAATMTFPDNSFDVVFSRAVFEHLPDPLAVISEIRRVLRPGGAMFLTIHLYTSDSGCHDSRILAGQRGNVPYWAHLQPEYEQAVRPNCYLNRLRLSDWIRLFQSGMPGSEVLTPCDSGPKEREELNKLRAARQLMSYSDEELLTVTLEVRWKRPLSDVYV